MFPKLTMPAGVSRFWYIRYVRAQGGGKGGIRTGNLL